MTPRGANGFGAYGDDDLLVYAGLGAFIEVQRWLTDRWRLGAQLGGAVVFGDGAVRGVHGPELSAGVVAMMLSRSRFRVGGGLGFEAVFAREIDVAANDHFFWVGWRAVAPVEISWAHRGSGNSPSIRAAASATWLPDRGIFPGVILTAGYEFGL
ncbi:MAG: hypothetical protein AAGE52_33465 [Myxococcota bacterium]